MTTPTQKKKRSRRGPGGDLHPSVVISGYYGFDNLGDELILRVLVDELKAHQVHITVLSQNPQKTAAEYGVHAIKRTHFIDIIDALSQSNLFISGGGGLFQDATGPKSTLYYGGLIHLARFFEVPVCFWAQGVGPLNRKLSRQMTASALKKCKVVTVRDEGSAALVASLIGRHPEITADPVWLLNVKKRHDHKQDKKQRYVQKELSPFRIGVSLRPWPELTNQGMDALANCLKELAAQSEQAVEFILLPFQKQEDTELLEGFARKLEGCINGRPIMVKPEEVLKKVGDCDYLLGMRFHSLILGLLHDVPIYGLIYDPKVASLIDMFHLQGTRISDLEKLDANAIREYFTSYAPVDLKPLKQQSRRNFQILNRLLEIPEVELVL